MTSAPGASVDGAIPIRVESATRRPSRDAAHAVIGPDPPIVRCASFRSVST
jgi:hypothetical protein